MDDEDKPEMTDEEKTQAEAEAEKAAKAAEKAEAKAKRKAEAEAKAAKQDKATGTVRAICTVKCQFMGRLFYPGDEVYQINSNYPRSYFKEV